MAPKYASLAANRYLKFKKRLEEKWFPLANIVILVLVLIILFVGVYKFVVAAIKLRIYEVVDKNASPEVQAQQAEAEEIKICQELSCQMFNNNFSSTGLY